MSEQIIETIPAETTLPAISGRSRFILKTAVFFLEISLIAGLLIWWLSSGSAHGSLSLWVFFLYCFPSEFLIATVPHEPVILYFAKFYQPLTIAWVAIAGTAITETMNYSAFKFVADLTLLKKMLSHKTVNSIITLFNRAPFLALWIAGFTPVPFYPFRFLVVVAHYPLPKYILAVILSRTPRFYLLALLGQAIQLSGHMVLLITFVLIVIANIPIIRKYVKHRRDKKQTTGEEF